MKSEQLLRAHPLVLSSSCCGLSHYTEFNVRPYVERRTTSRDDFSLLAPYKPLSRVHEYVVNILLFFRYFPPRKSVFIEKIIAIDHAVDRVATASPASSTISPLLNYEHLHLYEFRRHSMAVSSGRIWLQAFKTLLQAEIYIPGVSPGGGKGINSLPRWCQLVKNRLPFSNRESLV